MTDLLQKNFFVYQFNYVMSVAIDFYQVENEEHSNVDDDDSGAGIVNNAEIGQSDNEMNNDEITEQNSTT